MLKNIDLENIVKITVNWNCLQSIERAERDKAELENKGFVLVNQFGGMNESSLIYAKKQ